MNTANAIAIATNLRALCQALNDHNDADVRLESVVDLCNLPTYGGEAPADTNGIWSWDADSILVFCSHDSTYRVTSRNEQ